MPLVKLPFATSPYKNVDESALDATDESIVDGFIDELNNLNKRPGNEMVIDLGVNMPVDGLYWWIGKKYLIAICDGRVFKITYAAGVYTSTEIVGAGVALPKRVQPVFAEQGNTFIGHKLVITCGSTMIYTDGTNLYNISDADAPTTATHVAYIDGYILANNQNNDQINFSNINDPTAWEALDYFTCESNPDDIQSLLVGNGEVYCVGNFTTEIWYDDGVTPFSRSAVIPIGTIARYSTVLINGSIYMLGNDKKVYRLVGGRQAEIISMPFDKFIQGFTTVTDAVGYNYIVDGLSFYVLTFPTENRTIAYDYVLNRWYEWGQWSNNPLTLNPYDRFIGQSYCYCPDWGLHLVGCRWFTGYIYKASKNYFLDNTTKIRTFCRTGHISHGTLKNKIATSLVSRIRRGTANTDTTEGEIVMRWRNDKKTWGNPHVISLGLTGDYEIVKRFYRLGTYRTRQYEIVHASSCPFIMSQLEEEVEVLER